MYSENYEFNFLAIQALSGGDTSISESATDVRQGGLTFHPDNFTSSLKYMGQGMLAIFVTIAIIVVVTILINKIKSKK